MKVKNLIRMIVLQSKSRMVIWASRHPINRHETLKK